MDRMPNAFLEPVTWDLLKEIRAVLGASIVLLLVGILVTAAAYYVWCKMTGRGFQFEAISRKQLGLSAAMSVSIPTLVACFQSLWLCDSPGFEGWAILWGPDLSLLLSEALITFVLLWLFMKIRLWFRWPVLLLCLACWGFLAFSLAKTRGYA